MNVARRNQTARIARTAAVLGGAIILVAFLVQFTVFSSSRDKTTLSEAYPKLDSTLIQKVESDSAGTIRVIIEAVPGRTAEVIERVTALGAVVETSYENLIQVVAPTSLLPSLADDEAVRLIRLPLRPIEPKPITPS